MSSSKYYLIANYKFMSCVNGYTEFIENALCFSYLKDAMKFIVKNNLIHTKVAIFTEEGIKYIVDYSKAKEAYGN